MDFARSRSLASRLEYLEQAGSTNDELIRRATADAAGWGDLSVVVTDDQIAGRGRLGRTWLAPTGKSLAISLLVRPVGASGSAIPSERLAWLPLLAGTAMTRAVRAIVAQADTEEDGTGGHEVALKWPNDVLISGFKVCGILSEVLPDLSGVVIGAGLNVALDEHELPTLTSTSLALVTDRSVDPDGALAGYLLAFAELYRDYLEADGDVAASGLHAAVTAACGTLGSAVRVELPGDAEIVGTAEAIDGDGRLVVRDRDDVLQSVAAGDVTHLRY